METRKITIGQVCKFNIETIKSKNSPEIILYLDTGSITRNRIENIQTLDNRIGPFPSRAQRKVRKDTILYSTVRPIQEHFGFLQNPDENFIVSTGFLTINICDKEIDPKFLYYCITRKELTNYLQTIAENNVTSYPSINPDDLGNINLEIPRDKYLQQKIADILSALDSKIELNKRINDELESMAKTLYNYWLVQFDFPDKNGKPYKSNGGKMVWNEELKREIPDGWEVKTLSQLAKSTNESVNPLDFPDKEFKHYSIPTFDSSGTYGIEKGVEIKSNKFAVTETDILVSKLNPWFNRVVFTTDEEDLICSTEFVVWKTGNLEIKNYLYMIARDATFITYCTKNATGTSNSHKRVNPAVMMKFKIAYNKDIAEKFGAKIGHTIKMYAKTHIENQTLSSLRDWLLPMLMNGQVSVE